MRLERLAGMVAVVLFFCVPLFIDLGQGDAQNDESIYSYAVDSILDTGDWLNPLLSPTRTIIFLEKPPLKFWIVALPMRAGLLPRNDFGMRFWDAVLGSLAFLYVFAFGRRLAGPICGFFAVAVLFTFGPLLFDHGLRGNNMDAALLLSYCGAMYHFLRWDESPPATARVRHAVAVGLFFVLGFMTKFVAAAFLPLVLGTVALACGDTRGRLWRGRREWAGVMALVVALVAPWFVYQWLHVGNILWRVMIAEHVVQRFSTGLDPTHLHPWSYYFTEIHLYTMRAHSFWLVVAGAVLMVGRVVRGRWLAGTLTIAWFAVPMALISIGSSKLVHYAYPFVPPVALAAGYAVAWLAHLVLASTVGLPPGWASPAESLPGASRAVQRLFDWCRATVAGATSRRGTRRLAWLFTILAVLAVGFALVALLPGGRIRVGGETIWRSRSVAIPAFLSVVFLVLAGRGTLAGRIALPVMMLALAPTSRYWDTVKLIGGRPSHLQSARSCLAEVRASERREGRPVPDMAVLLPNALFQHQYFYYLHDAGWDTRADLSDDDLRAMLDVVGAQRPVLLPESRYRAFWTQAHRSQSPPLDRLSLGDLFLLLPGPFGRCGRE